MIIKRTIADFLKRDDGLAAVEAALIFPVLLALLMGTFDLGNAILANTKTVHASQTVADLVTRKRTDSAADVTEAIEAGRLAMEPLETADYGVDITSIKWDNNGVASIVWRKTQNMTPDPNVLNRVTALEEDNSGVVVVSVTYKFKPFFAHFLASEIPMMETAFARGRKSAVVNLQ